MHTSVGSWVPPEGDLNLRVRIGTSVLEEFVLGHDAAAVLRELAQNEFDAGGSRLEAHFRQSALEITGSGRPIDDDGWRRLSVSLGTGDIAGGAGKVRPKVNGLGSKNFGLRSLFLFGDRIWVRSNGLATVLDLRHGTTEHPIPDTGSPRLEGIHIHVAYRTQGSGPFAAFTVEKEAETIARLRQHTGATLLKLCRPERSGGLAHVAIGSERCAQHIKVEHSARALSASHRRFELIERRADIHSTDDEATTVRELEWGWRAELPPQFDFSKVPGYFREPRRRVRLGVSLRLSGRRRLDQSATGFLYYPIGVEQAFTGNAVSLSGPFEMNEDRSKARDSTNSELNAWLLKQFASATIELLTTDWFDRFGADAYLAVGQKANSALPEYLTAVQAALGMASCWPSNTEVRRIRFRVAKDLVVPASAELSEFVASHDALHDGLRKQGPASIATQCGVKAFTTDSLIRLRCAGADASHLETKVPTGAANWTYARFPNEWRDVEAQLRFVRVVDAPRTKLSASNLNDVRNAETTLSATNELRAVSKLWRVPDQLIDICPVPKDGRLHPALNDSPTLKKLSQPFDVGNWILEVAQKAKSNDASESERLAAYRWVMAHRKELTLPIQNAIRMAPMLRDHAGEWVSAASITARGTPLSESFRAVIHLPHKDFAKDEEIARTLKFRRRITADELVAFAGLVVSQPELAERCERALVSAIKLIDRRTATKLRHVRFLRNRKGDLAAPHYLFVDNKINRECIGDDARFPAGNAHVLYERIGCHLRPTSDAILDGLRSLRERGIGPLSPQLVYAELVRAMQREEVNVADLDDEPILWVGNGYVAPQDILVGGKWLRAFEGVCACVTEGTSKALRSSYEWLGARKQPDGRLWLALVVGVGQQFAVTRIPLSSAEQKLLRHGYFQALGRPTDRELPWLLDDNGLLWSLKDAAERRFLVSDDPGLANELKSVRAAIGFADASDPRLAAYFRSLGAMALTAVRARVTIAVGEARNEPHWFKRDVIVRKLLAPHFGDALERVVLADSSGVTGVADRVRSLLGRIRSIERIEFRQTLGIEYRVGATVVTVPTKCDWAGNTILFTWLQSWNELTRLIAQQLVQILFDQVDVQRRFLDSVFCLLTCESATEIGTYLQSKGVPWSKRWESEREDQAAVERDLTAALGSGLVFRPRPKVSAPADTPNTGPAKEPVPAPSPPVPPSLPALEQVHPRILASDHTWAPAPSGEGGGGGGSSGAWRPRSVAEMERDRLLGRRGEEIVLRIERERLVALGQSPDKVIWSSEANAGADHDIRTIDANGKAVYLEVKSTTATDGRFRWTLQEFQRAVQERSQYRLVRVYLADSDAPLVREFPDPVRLMLDGSLRFEVDSLRAEVEPARSAEADEED